MRPLPRSLGWQALSAGLALALLLSLGFWQTRRLAWKEALIARAETRMRAAPVAPPPRDQWALLAPEEYEYRHVEISGEFQHALNALVYAQAPPGGGLEPGFVVLTPLKLDDGGVVVVNRGFSPKSKIDQGAWKGEPAGRVSISGLLRAPQGRNMFTPEDDPRRGLWYTSDAIRIAAALGIEGAAPFILQQDPGADRAQASAEGLLRTPIEAVDIPNNHFSYAVTWFSLAAALAVVFALYARARLEEPRARA
ncbi:SURF1 family protein [Methylocystis heyeri]|uniref:SURF1-like protein n=1 Tax=Methylocystis heyeri TaxID=391905 RepID=A0A6B8KH68_9HYPH|nr:SURF1 family protein [Methylocystis heyeri]QGM47714.1 SURF1 family protein [Methylocystis heyeri]